MTGWTDYDTHARTCARDDLWGQVRRTVRGQALPAAQIDMIVDAVRRGLDLQADDVLLDLACGNGALTSRLHPFCAGSWGVDVSDYLVGVAQERFADPPRHGFTVADAAEHCRVAPDAGRFTKALCYGSLPYLDNAAVSAMLGALHERFPRVSRVFLGNLPDPARAEAFYPPGPLPPLRQPRSDLGVWRSAGEVAALAWPGWRLTASTMPPRFFAAHYRFDTVLERRR